MNARTHENLPSYVAFLHDVPPMKVYESPRPNGVGLQHYTTASTVKHEHGYVTATSHKSTE